MWSDSLETTGSYFVRSYNHDGTPATDGIRAGEEVTPGYPGQHWYQRDLIPVYEFEWIETDKEFVE
jgi:hypothetical protein